jgi:hypothetical protein
MSGKCRGGNREEDFFVVKTRKVGHCYKLCPFSEEYYDMWSISKTLPLVVVSGTRGNSLNFPLGGRDGDSPFGQTGSPEFSTHPTTEGGMITKSKGSGCTGWMCPDNDCVYFTTTGIRYFEL